MNTTAPSTTVREAWFPILGELLPLAEAAVLRPDSGSLRELHGRVAQMSRESLNDAWDYVCAFGTQNEIYALNWRLFTPAGRLIQRVLRVVSCDPEWRPILYVGDPIPWNQN